MSSATSILPAAPLSTEALCLHCRTPLAEPDATFCCHGCEHVHALLTERGLDRYYRLRGDATLSPVRQDEMPEEAWLEQMIESRRGCGVGSLSLDVQGLQCGACVWLIDALFKRMPGALRIDVNPALGRLTLVSDPTFPLREYVHTVEEFGYRLGPAQKQGKRDGDSLVLRTGVCAALAVNAMLLGAATYLGLESGALFDLVMNVSFVLATLSALVGGSYFVDRAIQGVRRGVLHLDLPIAVGMGLAYAGSVWSVYFGDGSASYLDTVSVFIALMLVGRLLQERLVEKNRRQLLASDGASGLLTRRVRQGQAELVAAATLETGDEILVCPGELVPVRAVLLSERAECALDWINGESEPRPFEREDELVAGAINRGRAAFSVRALCSFERSDLDGLLRTDDARETRVRGDFWDRLSRIYVWLVLAAALVGGSLWAWLSGPRAALDVATAVLVVTCPCAFGIATPLAYELAVSGLRKVGLFVRDASFFDRAEHVRRIVFDKTGTLTTGSLRLAEPEALAQLTPAQSAVLYDLTARSNHPKSQAVARALLARCPGVSLRDVAVEELPGCGLSCTLEGIEYRFGAPSYALGVKAGEEGPVFSANGRAILTTATCEDVRADAKRELSALSREGYELWIASGDREDNVATLARMLGVAPGRALAELTPDDKRFLVDRLDRRDTLMLGDGINDGPALSRALCSGTPAVDRPFVPARADFYYLTSGLSPVRSALAAARAVRRVVKRALVFATAYNVLAIGLAYAGLMKPWLAAILMPLSSIAVLTYTSIALSPRRFPWKS